MEGRDVCRRASLHDVSWRIQCFRVIRVDGSGRLGDLHGRRRASRTERRAFGNLDTWWCPGHLSVLRRRRRVCTLLGLVRCGSDRGWPRLLQPGPGDLRPVASHGAGSSDQSRAHKPDDVPAHVTVSVTSQDGSTTATESYGLSPRSYNQVNDLFLQEPWSAIYIANSYIQGGGAAASATIRSDTRLLAMAYVISNYNNSLTISLPR